MKIADEPLATPEPQVLDRVHAGGGRPSGRTRLIPSESHLSRNIPGNSGSVFANQRGCRHSWLMGTAGLLAALVFMPCARAEVLELLDKTKMNGKLVHYYDGVFTVETQGQTVKIPKEKVKSISFQLAPARPEFSTPEKTFERWRKALVEGNMEKVIDCYALMYQGVLAMQMGQATEGLKKMQKEVEGTKFTIKSSTTKGDTATLKVSRQKGDESDTGDVVFTRENGEWKMLPPQP